MILRTSLATCGALFLGSTQLLAQSPPVCDNGGPYSMEAQGAQTIIQLDGSASFDPDGTPVTYFWRDECPKTTIQNATTATPTLIIDHGPGVAACDYVCNFHAELKVTSGGESSKCRFVTTVSDTTAPVLSLPPDLSAVWGVDEDPSNTGFATAVDLADTDPVVTYSDVRTAPPVYCTGVEEWINRTWTATDACGNTSSAVQVITLLSPIGCGNSGGNANLEFDPTTGPNLFNVGKQRGVFTAELMSRGSFQVSEVDLSTVRLLRLDVAGPNVWPLRAKRSPMGDWMRATSNVPSQSSVYGIDGHDDITLSFSRRSVIKHLGLDTLAPGTVVQLGVTGYLNDGRAFYQADELVIE